MDVDGVLSCCSILVCCMLGAVPDGLLGTIGMSICWGFRVLVGLIDGRLCRRDFCIFTGVGWWFNGC